MNRSLFTVFFCALASAVVLSSACSTDLDEARTFGCEEDADCVEGYVCAGSTCEPVEEGFCSWSGDARCGPETYCFAHEGKYQCRDVPCTSTADCAPLAQECFFLSEDRGICRTLGEASKDDTCNPDREVLFSTPCDRNLVCIDVDGQAATCQSRCTPFEERECGLDEACYPITASEGVCVDLVRQPSRCPDNGKFAMCDESSVCSGVNSCVQLCRLGSNDCADGKVCNHYLWPGETNIGACLAPCASDDDCTEQFNVDGLICLDDRCIQGAKCSPDDDDCTRGFSCGLNGYCQ